MDRAGFKVNDYYAYEIEQSAIKISRYNYPSVHQCGDVFDEDFSKYESIDLLIGGSPCTFWSSSKCSKTAKYKREVKPEGNGWNLFMEYVRALHESNPKYFLYENNYRIDAVSYTHLGMLNGNSGGMSAMLPFMMMGGNMGEMFDGMFDFDTDNDADVEEEEEA